MAGAAEFLKKKETHTITANAQKKQKRSNFIEFYEFGGDEGGETLNESVMASCSLANYLI